MSDTTDIVARLSGMSADHGPDGWPAVQMRDITALCDEVTRLRAALAQAGAVREPVASVSRSNDMEGLVQWAGKRIPVGAPLYAHPSPAQREPLSDVEIDALIHSKHFARSYTKHSSDEVLLNWYRLGLRDGEIAHGITTIGTKGAT